MFKFSNRGNRLVRKLGLISTTTGSSSTRRVVHCFGGYRSAIGLGAPTVTGLDHRARFDGHLQRSVLN